MPLSFLWLTSRFGTFVRLDLFHYFVYFFPSNWFRWSHKRAMHRFRTNELEPSFSTTFCVFLFSFLPKNWQQAGQLHCSLCPQLPISALIHTTTTLPFNWFFDVCDNIVPFFHFAWCTLSMFQWNCMGVCVLEQLQRCCQHLCRDGGKNV